MAQQKKIALSSLLLDSQNPRLDEGNESQRDAIRALIDEQGEKLIVLAENGLNPIDIPLVIRDETGSRKRYRVLEGNRRVAALKLLNHPDLGDGALKKAQMQRLKSLGHTMKQDPIRTITCCVMKDRTEADTWIELRHRGEQAGAGIVGWGGTEAARFAVRRGRSDAALKIIDFVAKHGTLDDDTRAKLRRISITNLRRLIADPYVRRRLGIDKQKEEILTEYPETEVAKSLTRMVSDLANQKIIVSDIYTSDQRKKYVDGYKHTELPAPATRSGSALVLGTGEATGTAGTKPKKKAAKGIPQPRNTLIPKNCVLVIGNVRINKIYEELRILSLEKLPNAAAVLFRVFVELTIDSFIESRNLMTPSQLDGSKLRMKLTTVADNLENSGLMTASELAPIRQMTSPQHLIASSVSTMHGYVHNQYFSPSQSDLRTAWDNVQLFMERIWQ